MDPELKPHVLTAGGVLLYLLGQSIVGSWLESSGLIAAADLNIPLFLGWNLFLILILGCASVRPLIRCFITSQQKLGNRDFFIVKFFAKHEKRITWAAWAFFCLGAVVALPAMISEGFFSR